MGSITMISQVYFLFIISKILTRTFLVETVDKPDLPEIGCKGSKLVDEVGKDYTDVVYSEDGEYEASDSSNYDPNNYKDVDSVEDKDDDSDISGNETQETKDKKIRDPPGANTKEIVEEKIQKILKELPKI